MSEMVCCTAHNFLSLLQLDESDLYSQISLIRIRFSFGRDCENSSRIRSTTTEEDVEALSGLLLACEVGEDRGPDCTCAIATLAEAALPVCSISRISISLSSVCSSDSGTARRSFSEASQSIYTGKTYTPATTA